MAEGFAAVPTWMIRDTENVSKNAIMVYAVLATYTGYRSVFPGQQLLAKEARCSERTVRDALAELTDLGVVERVRRGGKGAGRLTDAYRLMDRPLAEDEQPEMAAGSGEQPAEMRGATGKIEQPTPLIEIDRAEIDRTPTPYGAGELESLFEDAWNAWPKKTERKKSFEKFKRIALRHKTREARALAEVIIKFGTAYAATTETRFVPALVVWLNGERWTDPLPTLPASRAEQRTASNLAVVEAFREQKGLSA